MAISLLEKLAGKTEEFEVDYNGIKILFRTLSQREYDEIAMLNPRTDIIGLELNKIPILARAIISIDGQRIEGYSEVSEQDSNIPEMARKEKVVGQMDAIVVEELFRVYAEKREEILKKKTQPKSTMNV